MSLVMDALRAIARGADVYAFLIGIVALGELASFEGVFDWAAARIAMLAGGSGFALFALLFGLGIVVTALLSNDTTAVMLTPAVLATARAVSIDPLPALFACAFVANAASFILPVSNPANLVVFDGRLPTLGPWLAAYALPSVAALIVTFVVLVALFRRSIRATYTMPREMPQLQRPGIVASIVLTLSACTLIVAAALGIDVGYTALVAAAVSVAVVACFDRRIVAFIVRTLAWPIVSLVAGLFVVVAMLDRFGAIGVVRSVFAYADHLGAPLGAFVIGALITLVSSVVNNLPVALIGGVGLQSSMPFSPWLSHAVLVSVDLGPNLALSGSLATLIWIGQLRRAGIALSWWRFLGVGAAVVVPSLGLALLLLR